MAHALVVGGTGMLAGVTRALALEGAVSVLARRPERVRGANIHALTADWHDDHALHATLKAAVAARGAFDLAVVWIHGSAPEAPYTVAAFVQGRYVHVLGSASADPSRPDTARSSRFAAFTNLRYETVILGFQPHGSGSRWLTDGEISAGVLQAVRHPSPRHVVGTVEPWSRRP